jgi:hypothetical protein
VHGQARAEDFSHIYTKDDVDDVPGTRLRGVEARTVIQTWLPHNCLGWEGEPTTNKYAGVPNTSQGPVRGEARGSSGTCGNPRHRRWSTHATEKRTHRAVLPTNNGKKAAACLHHGARDHKMGKQRSIRSGQQKDFLYTNLNEEIHRSGNQSNLDEYDETIKQEPELEGEAGSCLRELCEVEDRTPVSSNCETGEVASEEANEKIYENEQNKKALRLVPSGTDRVRLKRHLAVAREHEVLTAWLGNMEQDEDPSYPEGVPLLKIIDEGRELLKAEGRPKLEWPKKTDEKEETEKNMYNKFINKDMAKIQYRCVNIEEEKKEEKKKNTYASGKGLCEREPRQAGGGAPHHEPHLPGDARVDGERHQGEDEKDGQGQGDRADAGQIWALQTGEQLQEGQEVHSQAAQPYGRDHRQRRGGEQDDLGGSRIQRRVDTCGSLSQGGQGSKIGPGTKKDDLNKMNKKKTEAANG